MSTTKRLDGARYQMAGTLPGKITTTSLIEKKLLSTRPSQRESLFLRRPSRGESLFICRPPEGEFAFAPPLPEGEFVFAPPLPGGRVCFFLRQFSQATGFVFFAATAGARIIATDFFAGVANRFYDFFLAG